MYIFITILAIIVVVLLYVINIFNNLVKLKNRYLNAFAQIQVQLKRRYDLIPTLVETARGYMQHEKETLTSVINARNGANSSLKRAFPDDTTSIKELANANTNLTSELSKLNILIEDYPELKANENMIELHEELTTTENKVSFSRQAYNDAVMIYNTYKQSFPQNFFATRFGHTQDASLLEFEDSQHIKQMPKVEF